MLSICTLISQLALWVILLLTQHRDSATTQSSVPVIPPTLRRAIENREHLSRAAIETQVVEDLFLPGRVFLVQNTNAENGDCLTHEFGDQDGWVQYEDVGGGLSRFPLHFLTTTDGLFTRTGDSILISSIPRASESTDSTRQPTVQRAAALDARWLGISPFPSSVNRAGKAIAVPFEWPAPYFPDRLNVKSWSETREGSLSVVRAELPEGTIRWWIDTERDLNPVRVVGEFHNGQQYESRSSLEKTDGVWFPSEVTYLRDGQPLQSHFVVSADFKRSDAAARFTVLDLGAEPGFNIRERVAGGTTKIWDGEKAVSPGEWAELRRKGLRQPGPTVVARSRVDHPDNPFWTDAQREAWEKQHAESSRASGSGPLGPWERFTQEFIQSYQLNQEQTQKAMLILNHCLQEGDAYLKRSATKIQAVEASLREASLRADATGAAAAGEQMAELRKPLDQIFEQKPKPRLLTLPTRAQRAATQATSQPTP